MDTETLAVVGALTGVLGTLTGVAALIWQITVQHRSGPLVAVRSAYWMPVYEPPNAPQNDDQVAVTVLNRGRAPVTVTNYGVHLGDGRSFFVTERSGCATKLPASIAPGGQPAEVVIPVTDLRNLNREQSIPYRKMRAWVDLGDGRRVYSENAIPLDKTV